MIKGKEVKIEKSLVGKSGEETYNNIVGAFEARAKILRPVAAELGCSVCSLCDEELDILANLRIKWSNRCYPEMVVKQREYEEKIERLSKRMKQEIDKVFN